MLNRGGPVASRTVYPILARNFERAGLHIGIEPSPVTVTSIQKRFGFAARGLPPLWPEGRHNAATVELRAEEFCLQCHVDARIGDVLGSVTVRDYLSTRMDLFWEDVELTVTLNIAKILISAVLLFFLLRALMGPLLSLRAAVSALARGGGAGLATRASVRSSDEFGELANDLNHFLDHVRDILADLQETLSKMVSVSDRVSQLTSTARERLHELESVVVAAVPEPRGDGPRPGHDRSEVESRLEGQRYGRLALALPGLVHRTHELRHALQDLAHLEDDLAEVARSARQLLGRLLREPPPEALAEPAAERTGRG